MRITSITRQLRLVILAGAFCSSALVAQAILQPDAPASASQPSVVATQHTQPTSQESTGRPAERSGEVLRAGILPEPANLLPVAAIVGFSFLLGGIVSALKTRP